MNRVTLVITAFVLAVIATVAIYFYVQGVEEEAQGGGLVTVIVSTVDIPAGTALDGLIEQGAFAGNEIPGDALVSGAVVELSQLQGTIASAPILAGEQIPIARVSGDLPGGSLGIPEGLQAVSVSLSPQQAVGNMINQGDRVVVYGLFGGGGSGATSAVVIPDAQVLAVSVPEGGGAGVATIAVTPAEATRLIFAAGNGQPWLALLPPGESGTSVAPFSGQGIFTQ